MLRSSVRLGGVHAAVAALLVAVTVLRVVVDDPSEGIASLYALPVALAAIRWSRAAALAAAAIALALFAAGNLALEHPVGPLGYLTRAVLLFGVAALVNELAGRERRAEGGNRMLAALVDSSADAIASVSLDGTITSWNPAAERLYGHPAAEAIGRDASLVTYPDPEERTEGMLRAIAAGERVDAHDTVHLRRDGSSVEVALTMAPIRGSGGEVTGASIIARDIGERRRAEDRFRQLLELAPDAIIGFNRGCRIELVNTQVERMFGYSRGQLLGAPLEWLVPARLRAEYRASIERFLEDPRTQLLEIGEELHARREDGEELPCEVWLSSIPAEDGEVLGVASVRDVSARKAAQEETERLKSEFFALVSHELRTPLTSISGYADIIAEQEAERLTEQGRSFFEVIQRSTRRLDRLVQDLLLVAQLDAGTFKIQAGSVRVEQLVRECREELGPAAQEAGIELNASAGSVPEFEGDANRLVQVIDNLVSNAIKFTSRGGRVGLRAEERDGSCVLEVSDTGVGIDPEEARHLFDRFYRAVSASEGPTKGVGLGLAITKAIVDQHQGEIEVESEPGGGSTFRVTIPIRAPEGTEEASPGRGGAERSTA